MTKIIVFTFTLGLAFLEAGKLREATYHMALLAADATQHDMISLGQLSKALNGELPAKKSIHQHNLNSKQTPSKKQVASY
jgi:hypothetical protein